MPDIELTESQRDRLGAVQEELEAAVAGEYAHVGPGDAIEYLLDRYEADPDAGGEGGSGDAPDAGGAPDAGDEGDDENGAEDDGDGDEGDGSDEDDGGDADDGGDGPGDDDPVTGDDDAELDAMMNLLDEHDDVWGESGSSDAKYEVELPDGSTERARTKDDVRGLLFRHYR